MEIDQQLIFKIWFAGFYEGEGTISNDIGNNNRIRLSVAQNDITPLEKAKALWGGWITKRVRKSAMSDKICTGYEWALSHNPALRFIDDIKPYMIIPYKINQMERVLEASKHGSDERYTCRYCDLTYSAPSGRSRHERNQHSEIVCTLMCDVDGCERTFKTKDSMSRHKRINHTAEEAQLDSDQESSDEEIDLSILCRK